MSGMSDEQLVLRQHSWGAIGLVTGDVLASITGHGLRMAIITTARDMGFPFVFPILVLLGSLPGAFLAAVAWIVQRMLDRRTGLRSPLPIRSPSPGNARHRSVMNLSPLFRTKEERSKWREMRQRPLLSDDEFYQRFYADTGIAKEILVRIRHIYATQLAMDRVWPADKATEFDSELDLAELLVEVEEEFKVEVSDDEALKLDGSFDSLVRLVARKLRSASPEA